MNLCKKIGKSIAIAFSMYSKIPMVQFEWKEEDMRYSMCFFPLVGIVIHISVHNDFLSQFYPRYS